MLQKRYNQILYSENYLERLKDRYKKFQEKNDNLQKSLAKSIEKHWEELLQEKKKKAEKRVNNIERILNGNEEEMAMMRMTKAEIRMKNRMEKLHKRKYMSLWDKSGLPVLGHAYGFKNSDKQLKIEADFDSQLNAKRVGEISKLLSSVPHHVGSVG